MSGEDLQSSVSKDAASFDTMYSWHNKQMDTSTVRLSLENMKIWQEQQYQGSNEQ
jgi:hypothetical protein